MASGLRMLISRSTPQAAVRGRCGKLPAAGCQSDRGSGVVRWRRWLGQLVRFGNFARKPRRLHRQDLGPSSSESSRGQPRI